MKPTPHHTTLLESALLSVAAASMLAEYSQSCHACTGKAEATCRSKGIAYVRHTFKPEAMLSLFPLPCHGTGKIFAMQGMARRSRGEYLSNNKAIFAHKLEPNFVSNDG